MRKVTTTEAFGEFKTLREWSEDRRCNVSLEAIRRRYANGDRGDRLLRPRDGKGGPPLGSSNRHHPVDPVIDTQFRHSPWVTWHPPEIKDILGVVY